jgi:hypothetical protein
VIYIRNHRENPRDVEETNYWETPQALLGQAFLSFNAGVFRLLLPPVLAEQIFADIRHTSRVEIRRGPWVEEDIEDSVLITWEDGSKTPFGAWLSEGQYDRIPYDHDVLVGTSLIAWTPEGKLATWPARFLYRMPPMVTIDTPF